MPLRTPVVDIMISGAEKVRVKGRDEGFVAAKVPRPALIISTTLSMITVAILAMFLAQRLRALKTWRALPAASWLVLAIYIDSLLFVLMTAILSHGWGLNSSSGACAAAILLCLVCYMSTKLIYYFLVEKVYIIRRVAKQRMKSKLYLFNCFGVLVPFLGVIVLNFVFRINRFDKGTCIIGMERQVLLPLIIYDLLINIWLTGLFIMPLRQLYSYKNNPNSKLRTITIRTFLGSCVTLTSSIINLTVLMVLQGEPAWVCLMCCNSDILFNTIVVHWVTSKDTQSRSSEPSFCPSQGQSLSHNHVQHISIDTTGQAGSKLIYGAPKGTITTNISARDGADSIEEVSKSEFERDGTAAFEMGAIKVRTDHIREEMAVGTWERGEGEEVRESTSQGSTKDLVG